MENNITPADRASALIKEVSAGQSDMMNGYMKAGKALSEIWDEKLYMHYASHINSFDALLGDLKIKRTWGYNARRAYNMFKDFDTKGVTEERISKIMLVKDLTDEKKADLIEKAKVLSSRDFTDEIRELRGKVTSYDCPHVETYTICRECKKRI